MSAGPRRGPRKAAVRPPSLTEAIRARQAEMRARVEALRNRFVEPVLARFPRMLPTAPDTAAKYAIVSSILWFVVALLIALLLAVKLVFPKLLATFPWMSYGRLAQAESAIMTWGVLFTGFVGAIFVIVPRACRSKLWSERIAAQTIILLDQVVLAGVVLLLLGRTQGIDGGELIWPIDILLLNVMLMVAQNVFATVARRAEKRLAPPLWFFLGALVILPFTYAFGNLAAPWYFGVNQQIVAGFGAAGTTAALMLVGIGTAYYVLPRAGARPVHSEQLAWMGFFSLVFAAPFVGQANAILGPGPDYLETVAITFAAWLVIPALCLMVNVWGTLRGAWEKVISEPAVRFVVAGTAFMLFAALQFAAGSVRTVSKIVGATPWSVAQGTALVGALGFFLVALVYHQYPKIVGRALFSLRWAAWQFWLTTIGIATVVLSMSVAGVLQGYLQTAGVQTRSAIATGAGWSSVTLALRPLFVLRIAGGGLVALGLFLFVGNLIRTATSGADAAIERPPVEAASVGVSA